MSRQAKLSSVQSARKWPRQYWLAAAIVLFIGLAARIWMCDLGSRWGYFEDHLQNASMGVLAQREGLFRVYNVPPARNPVLRCVEPGGDGQRRVNDACVDQNRANYPPLGIALFSLEAKAFDLEGSLLNTFTARLETAILPMLAELALAAAVMALALQFAPRRAAFIAACACWLFPPLAMDSAFWGQTDAWVMAPSAWTIWLMLRGRWKWAGAMLALAILLKPQGLLVAPVVVLAAFLLPGAKAALPWQVSLRRILATGLTTLACIAIVTLPWTVAGGLEWLNAAYLGNFKMYPSTTLKAFNFWYADLLHADQVQAFGAIDSTSTWAGLSRDAWGRLLVLAAMGALAGLCAWRYRRRPQLAVVLFAGLWLWSTFLWPTRVHERYIIYCMPLMIAAAASMKRLLPALVLLAAIGAAEMSWSVWLLEPAGGYDQVRVQAFHQALQKEYQEKTAAIPTDRHPQAPTEPFAREQYWQQYSAAREHYRLWEMLAVAISLAGYAYAATAPFVRTPKEETSQLSRQ